MTTTTIPTTEDFEKLVNEVFKLHTQPFKLVSVVKRPKPRPDLPTPGSMVFEAEDEAQADFGSGQYVLSHAKTGDNPFYFERVSAPDEKVAFELILG